MTIFPFHKTPGKQKKAPMHLHRPHLSSTSYFCEVDTEIPPPPPSFPLLRTPSMKKYKKYKKERIEAPSCGFRKSSLLFLYMKRIFFSLILKDREEGCKE